MGLKMLRILEWVRWIWRERIRLKGFLRGMIWCWGFLQMCRSRLTLLILFWRQMYRSSILLRRYCILTLRLEGHFCFFSRWLASYIHFCWISGFGSQLQWQGISSVQEVLLKPNKHTKNLGSRIYKIHTLTILGMNFWKLTHRTEEKVLFVV